MISTLQKFTFFVLLLLFSALELGCQYFEGTHRTFTRSGAKEHFYENKREFELLADDWVSKHTKDSLVFDPWHMEEVRWNQISILKRDSHYVLREGPRTLRDAHNFAEAAKIAGAEPLTLSSTLATIQKLGVASVHIRQRGAQGDGDYLLIGLQESGADYGYIYVPAARVEAQALVDAAAQSRPGLIGMNKVEKLAAQWFYFEGK
ncbi:MAG: hypothetical protein JWO13_3524 [Acidobacteriales bacterium]|nr:hypothetical protein [Terriglobales bacterium]